jgi:hypothetical protein
MAEKKLDTAKLKEIIGFYPNPKQKEILQNLNRFTVVVGGRRLGKTILAAYIALKELFFTNKSVWIIAPTHDLADRIWEYLDLWIRQYFDDRFSINKHEHIIENLTTHSKLWTKTTESPQSLRGKGLDLAILDEASVIPNGIWDGHIKPNLMDHNGRAFFISNPFGYNWFYDIFLLGTPEGQVANPSWTSFQIPTAIEDIDGNVVGTNNPAMITVDELKSNKTTTPIDIWRQEYLAEFREGAGQLFKNFDKCIDDSVRVYDENEWFEDPQPGHLYFVGVDVAKVEDYTVAVVIDRMTHRVVGFYRVNNVSWMAMKKKIKDISNKYNLAEIVLDATGNGGDQFAEDLAESGANINTKFVYTNKTKMMLIDKLSILMDKGKIRFPRISQLVMEIRSFTYHFTPSGNMIYGSSKKDDCLNALALACWMLNEEPIDDTQMDSVYRPARRGFA